MPEVSATDAARNFADLLDAVEHRGAHYTIVRRGRPVAQLHAVTSGRGAELKTLLRRQRPDTTWAEDIHAVRDLLEAQDRA